MRKTWPNVEKKLRKRDISKRAGQTKQLTNNFTVLNWNEKEYIARFIR